MPTDFYQHLALKYHVHNLIFGVAIRAIKFGQAEYIEWNIGYRFRKPIKKKKLVSLFSIIILVSIIASAQDNERQVPNEPKWIAKGGVRTSWLTFPKVFIVDENDAGNVWSVSPAVNSVTFFLGVQYVIPLGKHWLFIPEIDYHYLSGEVNVNRLKDPALARKLQSYSRISVPLNFGVVSSDNFWFGFGPTVYFTIADNKGFEEAVSELTTATNINSDVPVGVAARLAAIVDMNDRL